MSGFPDRSFSLTLPAHDALSLTGKRVAVIGGTDGLGRAIARAAADRGAEVTVVGRTFRDEGVRGLQFVKADLSSMKEALRLGQTLPVEALDAVVMTTGIIAAPERQVTAEGLERDMAISFLSRVAVLRGLPPRLGTARPAGSPAPRVFVMGFPGTGQLGDLENLTGEQGYGAMAVHGNTVAGNEALVLEQRRKTPSVHFFGLNPGLVKTGIRSNFMGEGSLKHRVSEFLIGLFTKTPEGYAARVVPLLTAPELEGRSGVMFGPRGNPILPSDGLDDARVEQLMAASNALVDRGLASR